MAASALTTATAGALTSSLPDTAPKSNQQSPRNTPSVSSVAVRAGTVEVSKALQEGEKFIKWDEVSPELVVYLVKLLDFKPLRHSPALNRWKFPPRYIYFDFYFSSFSTLHVSKAKRWWREGRKVNIKCWANKSRARGRFSRPTKDSFRMPLSEGCINVGARAFEAARCAARMNEHNRRSGLLRNKYEKRKPLQWKIAKLRAAERSLVSSLEWLEKGRGKGNRWVSVQCCITLSWGKRSAENFQWAANKFTKGSLRPWETCNICSTVSTTNWTRTNNFNLELYYSEECLLADICDESRIELTCERIFLCRNPIKIFGWSYLECNWVVVELIWAGCWICEWVGDCLWSN